MIKRIALGLILATTIQAELTIDRFEYDEAIAVLFVDPMAHEFDPEAMLAINFLYKEWAHEVCDKITSYDDIKYVSRLAHVYSELMLTYYFPVEDTLPV